MMNRDGGKGKEGRRGGGGSDLAWPKSPQLPVCLLCYQVCGRVGRMSQNTPSVSVEIKRFESVNLQI